MKRNKEMENLVEELVMSSKENGAAVIYFGADLYNQGLKKGLCGGLILGVAGSLLVYNKRREIKDFVCKPFKKNK